MHRRYVSLLAAFLVTLAATLAFAAPRDAAATKKIDEAINEHYLTTQFDKAEAVLTGTITACGDKCSPSVIAKAWMYVGVVRGSGKSDQAGAREAFEKAVAADANVKLDEALATPDTKKTFDAVAGGGGTATPPETPPTNPPSGPSGGGEEAGNMTCTPEVREVETRRIIPISCMTDEDDVVKGELKYKEFGGDSWKTVKLHRKGDYWQGEIPCTATQMVGPLRVYVRVQNRDGDTVDSWGSKSKPVEFAIKNETDAEAPSYPDRDAPERCKAQVECPPDFPGCNAGEQRGNKAWGDSCSATQECQAGLSCTGGQCESAQTCDVDADCTAGKCVAGSCQAGGDTQAGPYKKNWIGVHVGFDLAFMGGDDVCSPDSQQNNGYACFYNEGPASGNQYQGSPQPGRADSIKGGIAPATVRLMLSYDRALTQNFLLGARVGYAFNGGPDSNGTSFMPFHAEARLSYWFGKDVLSKKGIRPYVALGGGLAQVDAKLPVTLIDCGTGSAVNPACLTGSAPGQTMTLDAWKKLGQSFISVGGGAMYALTPNSGLQLNLNVMFMLPTSGTVLEPSLGYVFGL
ncbi:MAG: hypothetical protein OZ928_06195 [Polyangiaceae bacterium]|nr:hypothetical protein [Polyangiaceae bacterium]